MFNKELPRTLRALGRTPFAKNYNHDIELRAAAAELETLRLAVMEAFIVLDKLECDDIQAESVFPLRDRLRDLIGGKK